MKFYTTTLGQSSFILTTLSVMVKTLPLNDTHSTDRRITKRQSGWNCPVTCDDPRDVTYDNPCGNCDHSHCIYEGCIFAGPFFTMWFPDACSSCICRYGWKMCTQETCHPMECFGYPTVKRPGKCCEECDFGAREDECMAVPVGWKEISSLRRDKKQNCSRFLEHGCNKKYVWSQLEWYMCEPMEELVSLKAVPGCEDVPFDIYLHDIVKCIKRLADVQYDIPADYTPDPRTVCQPVPSKP